MKNKRPKVRFVAINRAVYSKQKHGVEFYVEDVYASRAKMKRIATALNFHEAHKRGEL